MTAIIVRGDARHLPLPDASVDLVVTSPPYFALRAYTDGGEAYGGQIGAEDTPGAYLEALWEATREWARVLKPEGSIFVLLGDKYAVRDGQGGPQGSTGQRASRKQTATYQQQPHRAFGAPAKSLMLLPERYRIGCVDRLGLIARAVILWDKPNGMPESVTDRVRRSHEDWVHLTRQPSYFSAVDDIREPHTSPGRGASWAERKARGELPRYGDTGGGASAGSPGPRQGHRLGRLPGSVWEVATQPFTAPDHLAVDHYAAMPPAMVRRIILGWSPSGICTACGEGRRPVVDRPGLLGGDNNPASRDGSRRRSTMDGGSEEWAARIARPDRITGYACACKTATAPTRPALVVDPFGGTGTTAMVADVLGRTGVSVDLSADYCRLARWRTTDPRERARALGVTPPPPVGSGQGDLFDTEESA